MKINSVFLLLSILVEYSLAQWWDNDVFDDFGDSFGGAALASGLLGSGQGFGARRSSNFFNPWMRSLRPAPVRRRNWWENSDDSDDDDDDDDDNDRFGNRFTASRFLNQRRFQRQPVQRRVRNPVRQSPWGRQAQQPTFPNWWQTTRFDTQSSQQQQQSPSQWGQNRWGQGVQQNLWGQGVRQNRWGQGVRQNRWGQQQQRRSRPQNQWGSLAAQMMLMNDFDLPDFGFDFLG